MFLFRKKLNIFKINIVSKNWISSIVDNSVKFSYVTPDNEGGFPGEVWVDLIYRLDNNENRLTIEFKAITDKPTPINLTNHAFYNLNGHDSGVKIYNHELKLNSDKYLDFNPNDVTVTGKINSVENTKYDFRNYTKLADRIKGPINWPDEGFDNFFLATDSTSNQKHIASIKNPSNGIKLDIETDQLGIQFYSGNFLNQSSNGVNYKIHEAFCLETHNYPDSVNHESFPSCVLTPDQEYYQKTSLIFSIEK